MLFFLLFAVVLAFQSRVWGGIIVLEDSPHGKIHSELNSTFSQPNPWNYILSLPISYETNSIAYTVSGSFAVCHKGTTDVEKAGKLYFSIYSHFIRKCNDTRILRPFLETFPLTPSQAKLSLRFDENHEDICAPPKIAAITLGSTDIIRYSLFTRTFDARYTDVLTVSAKDVPEIAQFYQKGCPRKVIDPKPTIPLLRSIPRPLDGEKALFSFLREYCKKLDLGLIAMGYVGPTWKDKSVYGFAVISRQLKNFEDARKLACICARDTFDFVKHDKGCLEHIKSQSALDFPIHPSSTPVPAHVAFRISFWDENVDRPVQPYIAEIRYLNGVFKYYTADDLQKLVLVYQETFDEAMKFLEQPKD
jgi:hypothetical protein